MSRRFMIKATLVTASSVLKICSLIALWNVKLHAVSEDEEHTHQEIVITKKAKPQTSNLLIQ